MNMTATDTLRFNLRKRRAETLIHAVIREVEPLLRDEPRIMEELYKRLIDLFHAEGVEILTDYSRSELGLPPRGPDGWTPQEILALEEKRLELIRGPIQPLAIRMPSDQE